MREKALLKTAAGYAEVSSDTLLTTAQLVLGHTHQGGLPGKYASKLNNDGSPLQVCLSCSMDNVALRVLGDPASDFGDIVARHQVALSVLNEVLETHALGDLCPLVETSLDLNLPSDIGAVPALASGTMWLAVPVGKRGIAVYLKGNWGEKDAQWQRVRNWLQALIPTSASRTDLLSRLSSYAEVASVGVEGVDARHVRYKVYFRLTTPTRIDELGIDLFTDQRFPWFLNAALGNNAVARSGLLFCIGFSPQDGWISDAKIDLCGHCLEGFVSEWPHYLAECALAVGLSALDVTRLHLNQSTQIAFMGFGIANGGSSRLNLYLKGYEDL